MFDVLRIYMVELRFYFMHMISCHRYCSTSSTIAGGASYAAEVTLTG